MNHTTLISSLVISCLSVSSFAAPSAQKRFNEKEAAGTQLAREWMSRNDLPAMKDNGKLVYLFGATLPSIVCAPLHTCDIELQSGEVVKDVHVGDSVRWKVTPAVSGLNNVETTHVIVKPTDVDLFTTMVITTDRRTYHLKLVSDKTEWMPFVGFEYPDEIWSQWAEYQASRKHVIEEITLPETGENIAHLNFEYCIEGKARWKPLRVYNNGIKTIIQMPKAMSQSEAPALLVVDYGSEQLVNYRVQDDRYIIDQIFDKAILVTGVGRKQQRITITRESA